MKQQESERRASRPRFTPPFPLTLLIGRSSELRELRRRIVRDGARLITLSGPPGVGKTRLAIEAAGRMAAYFDAGARVVDLAPLSDPTHILPAIARALEGDDQRLSAIDWLKRTLQQTPLLLLLDNVEHLLPDVAPDLADLLEACPLLTILATSREALHIRGEHVFLVQPLTLPDASDAANVNINRLLQRAPAVALFVQRAIEVVPGFALTSRNTPAVIEVCAQLDGLPLAIELAAARIALFQPEELRDHLKHPLELLADGPRDVPARHQTLRAAIGWSYDLLQPAEQALLRCLGVFSGGFTMDAVAVVCATEGNTVGLLTSLARKNLVQVHRRTSSGRERIDDLSTRFSLLETIREYTLEQLARHPTEHAGAQLRHTAYYLELAELAAAGIMNPDRTVSFDHLEQDYDNLRSVLRRVVIDAPDAERAARLIRALGWFWYSRGYLHEGWYWMEEVLKQDADLQPASQASVRLALTGIGLRRGDFARALAFADEGIAILRRINERADLCHMLGLAGQAARGLGDLDRAEDLLKESLDIAQELQHTWHRGGGLWALSHVALARGDLDRAENLASEALDLWWELDDKQGSVLAMDVLAAVAYQAGELNRSRQLSERNLALRRGLGDRPGVGVSLRGLAEIAHAQSQHRRATSLYLQSIDIALEVGDLPGTTACLEGLATIELRHDRLEWAATLFGATERARAQGGMPSLDDSPETRGFLEQLNDRLAADVFAAAWRAGRERPLDETIRKLQSHLVHRTSTANSPEAEIGRQPVPLSPRERQVATLIAAGRDNTSIGSELVLSKRTVETHVSNILRKLGLQSRVEIVLWAIGQGLTHGDAP